MSELEIKNLAKSIITALVQSPKHYESVDIRNVGYQIVILMRDMEEIYKQKEKKGY